MSKTDTSRRDDGALLNALRTGFASLVGSEDDKHSGIAIAVSGGPDSMALLALARTLWTERIKTATVDHGLRPDSAEEAQMVADYCAKAAIPHAILRPDQPITGNVQSAARAARYGLLDSWRKQQGCQWLLTAHHADDQLETMVMRLNRGSGVAGLAGIRTRNGHILRPLLAVGKADLLAYCQRHDIPFVDDPSNSDARFDRARLRTQLAQCDWLDPETATQSAHALAQADSALHWMAQRETDARITEQQDALICDMHDSAALPHELVRRITKLALERAQPGLNPRGEALERVIDALKSGQTVTQGHVLCQAKDGLWRFSIAPPRANNGYKAGT
ncbi:tRNA lysidine(34) synthetase TilS [Alterisphingorhabdus coralli]|uniref:tRNA(Ile)-lysidine synthase n=1 Tax=Alterisphingorhabdus coralli TaxID=3071408 RepID=A0AA97F886_9SPHN|nr:tRNA lysidine(34) synthetase TilS [Parasphingorhabdus sp. SCSIO 66989]WOE75097.1 tRNA lysidine(34) synthetase TilS [Parasphingorhabdus sp. SCSIO 66989]